MKEISNFLKRNAKLLTILVVGIMLSGIGVYATIIFDSSEVNFDNTSSNLTLNNQPVTNVQDAVDALYRKLQDEVPPCALKLGDYFTLVPDKSSFTIYSGMTGHDTDQTITPNELTLWRVIDIHKDGSFDAVSEYVSSTGVYFQGATGYQYFVSTLQTIAAQYAKVGYTIGTRMMGYGGQTGVIQAKPSTCTGTCQTTTTYAFDGSTNASPTETTTPNLTTGIGQEYLGGVGGDTLYLKDYQLVGSVYKNDTLTYGTRGLNAYNVSNTTSLTPYWLASRGFGWTNASNFGFNMRYVTESGVLGDNSIRYFYYAWEANSRSSSLRPIITLKSGLTKTGNHLGTKGDPYTLS